MTLKNTRRDFLRMTAAAAGAAMLPGSIRKALAIPADIRTGTINDVEHVVILMQENRSFDHYFGTLRGVRGFNDPRPVMLPNGKPVWYQPPAASGPNAITSRGLRPTRHMFCRGISIRRRQPSTRRAPIMAGAAAILPGTTGTYDQWVNQKQDVLTMGYLKRQDVSFHYALADAFTLCDSYFCSAHANTVSNRIYLWTRHVRSAQRVWDASRTAPALEDARHTERLHLDHLSGASRSDRHQLEGLSGRHRRCRHADRQLHRQLARVLRSVSGGGGRRS